jgi:hypothetical protein
MMAIAAAIACGAVAFFSQRVAHGRTAEDRAGYAVGERMGSEAPAASKLPNDAALNDDGAGVFQTTGIRKPTGLGSRL